MNIFLKFYLFRQRLRDKNIGLFSGSAISEMIRNLRSLRNEKKDYSKNEESGYFEVDNWELSKFIVKKIIPITGYKPFPLNELLLLVGSVIRLRPDAIFEWGTNVGKSALIFYETKEYFNIDCQIHSIDLPDDTFHQEHPHFNRGYLVRGKNVHLHLGDGINTSMEILSR